LLAPLFFSILLAFFSLFQRQRYPFLAFLNQPDSRDENKMKGGDWTRNNQQTN
jgi:hypothetical protein